VVSDSKPDARGFQDRTRILTAVLLSCALYQKVLDERTSRAADVVRQISGYSSGQQTFLGPSLVVPYRYHQSSGNYSYIVFPAEASAVVKTATEERRRSLFRVPVFHADLTFEATFDFSGTPSQLIKKVPAELKREGKVGIGGRGRGASEGSRTDWSLVRRFSREYPLVTS